MTDEEKAEEYTKGLCKTCTLDTCRNNTMYTCAIKEYIKQAFLAGLKAGRPKWHLDITRLLRLLLGKKLYRQRGVK